MDTMLTAKDGHKFKAYVNGDSKAKIGVLVLPEIFGVNANIREMADNFVEQGYRVISPSLFDRISEAGLELSYDKESVQKGLAIRRAISDETALMDIATAAAAAYFQEQSLIFITGYCWGGYLSWRAACTNNTFAAASCWHGGGTVKHKNDVPLCPVQMHFGGKDASIPLSEVEEIRAAQPDVDIYIYPNAQHAFGRRGTDRYDAESAKLAWQRTFDFFGKIAK